MLRFFCASGPVQVMRSLYSTRKDVGMPIGEGFVRWLYCASGTCGRALDSLVACGETSDVGGIFERVTPGEGEAAAFPSMFGGSSATSKSSLDRLPKQLGQLWERELDEFEDVLRAQERVRGGSGEHGRYPHHKAQRSRMMVTGPISEKYGQRKLNERRQAIQARESTREDRQATRKSAAGRYRFTTKRASVLRPFVWRGCRR